MPKLVRQGRGLATSRESLPVRPTASVDPAEGGEEQRLASPIGDAAVDGQGFLDSGNGIAPPSGRGRHPAPLIERQLQIPEILVSSMNLHELTGDRVDRAEIPDHDGGYLKAV